MVPDRATYHKWLLFVVTRPTIQLKDITEIPIGKRNTSLFENERVFFKQEILRLKKLGIIKEAANEYGG